MHKKLRKSDITVTPQQVEKLRSFGYVTAGGVVYDFGLCVQGGMFRVMNDTNTTQEQLDDAARQLLRDQDVVGSIYICAVVPDIQAAETP